jgi:hypothetical protein
VRVSDVFHRTEPRAAGVAYYDDGDVIRFGYFDYAILTMPHDATAAVVSRLGYSPQPLNGSLLPMLFYRRCSLGNSVERDRLSFCWDCHFFGTGNSD